MGSPPSTAARIAASLARRPAWPMGRCPTCTRSQVPNHQATHTNDGEPGQLAEWPDGSIARSSPPPISTSARPMK